MKEVYNALVEKLNSMSREELDAEYESITHEGFWKRWVEKFHNLTPEKRSEIVEKARSKYETDKYKEKEFKRSREPQESLFDLFLEYGSVYGKEEVPDKDFCEKKVIIDGKYAVRLFVGQGSFITVEDYIEENTKEKIRECISNLIGEVEFVPKNTAVNIAVIGFLMGQKSLFRNVDEIIKEIENF